MAREYFIYDPRQNNYLIFLNAWLKGHGIKTLILQDPIIKNTVNKVVSRGLSRS